jgi:hypothetical protein
VLDGPLARPLRNEPGCRTASCSINGGKTSVCTPSRKVASRSDDLNAGEAGFGIRRSPLNLGLPTTRPRRGTVQRLHRAMTCRRRWLRQLTPAAEAARLSNADVRFEPRAGVMCQSVLIQFYLPSKGRYFAIVAAVRRDRSASRE